MAVRSLPKLSKTGVLDFLEDFDFVDFVDLTSSNSGASESSVVSSEKSSLPITDLYSSFTTL